MNREYLILVPTGEGQSKWYIGYLACVEAKTAPGLKSEDYDPGEMVIAWFNRDTEGFLCLGDQAQIHALPFE